jgi:hypothetical protein
VTGTVCLHRCAETISGCLNRAFRTTRRKATSTRRLTIEPETMGGKQLLGLREPIPRRLGYEVVAGESWTRRLTNRAVGAVCRRGHELPVRRDDELVRQTLNLGQGRSAASQQQQDDECRCRSAAMMDTPPTASDPVGRQLGKVVMVGGMLGQVGYAP